MMKPIMNKPATDSITGGFEMSSKVLCLRGREINPSCDLEHKLDFRIVGNEHKIKIPAEESEVLNSRRGAHLLETKDSSVNRNPQTTRAAMMIVACCGIGVPLFVVGV